MKGANNLTATIYFSDKSALILHENDYLIPVVFNPATGSDPGFSSMSKPVELYPHVHDGLIPSILDVLLSCQFFYAGNDCTSVYCTSSIVKIESE